MRTERVILVCDVDTCWTEGPDVQTVRGNLGWKKEREADLCSEHRASFETARDLIFRYGRRADADALAARPAPTGGDGTDKTIADRIIRMGRRALRYQCPDCERQPRSAQGYRAHRSQVHGVQSSDEAMPEPVVA